MLSTSYSPSTHMALDVEGDYVKRLMDINYVKNIHDMYRLKCWLPLKVYIWIQMVTKTQDPYYSAERPNTILEINISFYRHKSA